MGQGVTGTINSTKWRSRRRRRPDLLARFGLARECLFGRATTGLQKVDGNSCGVDYGPRHLRQGLEAGTPGDSR